MNDTQSPNSATNSPADDLAQEATAAAAAVTAEIDLLRAQLDKAATEAEELRQRHLRAVADLENYRRRALRERDEARKAGTIGLLEDLIPVVDNFAMGLGAAQQHAEAKVFAEGFAMVLNQLQAVLTQNGVERLEPKGQAFDPNLHEAVNQVAHAEIPEGHVVEVVRVGYRLGERLVRPASVLISRGPAVS